MNNKKEIKKFLNRLKFKKNLIKQRQKELQELKELITTVSSQTIGAVVSTNNNYDKIGNSIVKIEEKELEIQRLLEEYLTTYTEVEKVINKVTNAKYQMLLRLKYINDDSWETISYKLNYDYYYTFRVHKQAIEYILSNNLING